MGTLAQSTAIAVAPEDVETARATSSHAGDHSGDVADVDYSVFTISQRRFIVFMASWAGFFFASFFPDLFSSFEYAGSGSSCFELADQSDTYELYGGLVSCPAWEYTLELT